MDIPSSPARAWCGSCRGAGLGGYFCAGAVQEAPPGEESIHPAAETSSAAIFLVKHKASGREREAGGRLASGGAAPCQEPLFPGPCAPKGHLVLRGDSGVTLGPATSLGEGQERRGVFASRPIAWLQSTDTADTERCCVWSSRSCSLLHP